MSLKKITGIVHLNHHFYVYKVLPKKSLSTYLASAHILPDSSPCIYALWTMVFSFYGFCRVFITDRYLCPDL